MQTPGTRFGNGWSFRAQLATIVIVVGLVITGTGVWLAIVTMHDAEATARRDTTFQASLGAAAVADALVEGESGIAGLAPGFPVDALLADPSQCRLAFSDLGVFPTGHIDIVLPDGRVPCSSVRERGAPPGATQAGAGWLTSARPAAQPGVAGLFTDRLTGQQALAMTAPITDESGKLDGFVALVLPLAGLDEGLAQSYGGPQHFSFTVRTRDGRLLAGGPEAPADSTPEAASGRIVGQQTVPGLGWVISAQESRDAALAPTRTAFLRLAALVAAAFVLLLGLLGVVNRRIGNPLRRLTAAAAQAGRQVTPEPVLESGPAEVRRLARQFNEMIAARAGYESTLSHHALHDPLTGLPNRVLGLDRIKRALQAAGENPARVAVVSVDLDRFKVINASLGYRTGDDVLSGAATRFAAVLEPTDTVARSGGDGFLICRPDVADNRAAEGLAAHVLDCLVEPFAVAGTDLAVTASVGIARGRRGVSPEDLVRDADTAMYSAKEAGGGRFRLIDDELRSRSSERLSLEADLRVALAQDQLHVEYQPVVNMLNGQITGAEALLRWTHPTRGPVSPLTFIPLAEESGLIGPIGQWVLEQACRQAADWSAAGHRLRVAVNVSGLQLHDVGFLSQVAAALHATGLDPSQLCLELTETTLMDDAMRVTDLLHELKDVGVDLSVDDFGTGYSSLAYLKRFPVDELKIDRCFVQNVGDPGQDQTLVSAMVAMGHALGLHVVAEGVETHAQMATLLTLGCRTAQGYLFSKPQSASRISALLQSGLPEELLQAVGADPASIRI
jgi:diguanylate cyclase (GGDEF)-like protein